MRKGKCGLPLVDGELAGLDGAATFFHEEDRGGPLNAAGPLLDAVRVAFLHWLAFVVHGEVVPKKLGSDCPNEDGVATLRDDVVAAPVLLHVLKQSVVDMGLVV